MNIVAGAVAKDMYILDSLTALSNQRFFLTSFTPSN